MDGIWVSWGVGRVPVGVDTTQTEFNTVEKTGGEKTHKLTMNEIPKTTTNVELEGAPGLPVVNTAYPSTGGWGAFSKGAASEKGAPMQITVNGGEQPHNNIQPYITCYMWKRTA